MGLVEVEDRESRLFLHGAGAALAPGLPAAVRAEGIVATPPVLSALLGSALGPVERVCVALLAFDRPVSAVAAPAAAPAPAATALEVTVPEGIPTDGFFDGGGSGGRSCAWWLTPV